VVQPLEPNRFPDAARTDSRGSKPPSKTLDKLLPGDAGSVELRELYVPRDRTQKSGLSRDVKTYDRTLASTKPREYILVTRLPDTTLLAIIDPQYHKRAASDGPPPPDMVEVNCRIPEVPPR
jgi:hypothetical protein